jgi:hypothetical protein
MLSGLRISDCSFEFFSEIRNPQSPIRTFLNPTGARRRRRNVYYPASKPAHFCEGRRMDMRTLQQRLNVASLPLILVLGTGVAALTFTAGFSVWVSGLVGMVTAAVGCWAFASEP